MTETVELWNRTLARTDTVVEVKQGLRAVRNLRDALVSLAFLLADGSKRNAYLVLIEPKISLARLERETDSLRTVLRKNIWSRLKIVVVDDGHFSALKGAQIEEIVSSMISELVTVSTEPGTLLPRPDYFFVVLKVLTLRWLSGKSPVTTKWIMKHAGCSYPTVSSALRRLGRAVQRHSDRKIELNRFPREPWSQLLTGADRIRQTMRFADRSGKPRSPKALYRRLRKLDLPDVAVGGTMGARHWHPSLDLVGDPRLDLAVHCPGNRIGLDFVRLLDPALKQTNDPLVPHSLALHTIRRAEPLFDQSTSGPVWADPVECLLDLQETRFERQANELVDALIKSKGGR